nr:polymorphic toxin type 15 domain-containing protein [uncultured Pseudomonas sp.]
MVLWNIVPSWFEIEDRLTHDMGYQGGHARIQFNEYRASLGLTIRRVHNVRIAFARAEWIATGSLRQRFANLDICSILTELISVINQMAMIVAGSVLAGGVIGAGVGAFGGGAGAIPIGMAGAAMGLQVSSWILGVLGLVSIAEFFVEGLPRIGGYYLDGINIAWRGSQGDEGLDPYGRDEPFAVDRASQHIAQGHEEVVVLLLGAIVAYLTRGRGNAQVLAREMQASAKVARLGQWMLKHEEALKKHPDLQPPKPQKGAIAPQEWPQPTRRQPEHPSPKKPLGMPEHKVPCFNVSNKHGEKIPEFDRQLAGQERGLNDLSVDEYLRGREAFRSRSAVRDPQIAATARKELSRQMEDNIRDKLRMEGIDPGRAKILAKEMVIQKMATLAALHNPDLFAGGKDVISDFGDRRINASIGPQWNSRIGGLDAAASNVPEAIRSSTKISAKLERCR